MPLIVIDGPEKAGKSTLAKAIVAKYGGTVRAWGPVKPDDRVYATPLGEDCTAVDAGKTVVWDRSWASEHVYANLLARDRRLRNDAWLGEWLYGRAVQTAGIRVMKMGPSITSLIEKRDETDLPVEPWAEWYAFLRYAQTFKWMTLIDQHNAESLARSVDAIWLAATYNSDRAIAPPPRWAGPNLARTIYVGEARNHDSKFPGAWLPFSSPLTTEFARMVPNPFDAGWTNAADCPPQALRYAKTVVACGEHAQKWARYHVGKTSVHIIDVAHPAYALRFKTPAGLKARSAMVRSLMALGKENNSTDRIV